MECRKALDETNLLQILANFGKCCHSLAPFLLILCLRFDVPLDAQHCVLWLCTSVPAAALRLL